MYPLLHTHLSADRSAAVSSTVWPACTLVCIAGGAPQQPAAHCATGAAVPPRTCSNHFCFCLSGMAGVRLSVGVCAHVCAAEGHSSGPGIPPTLADMRQRPVLGQSWHQHFVRTVQRCVGCAVACAGEDRAALRVAVRAAAALSARLQCRCLLLCSCSRGWCGCCRLCCTLVGCRLLAWYRLCCHVQLLFGIVAVVNAPAILACELARVRPFFGDASCFPENQ